MLRLQGYPRIFCIGPNTSAHCGYAHPGGQPPIQVPGRRLGYSTHLSVTRYVGGSDVLSPRLHAMGLRYPDPSVGGATSRLLARCTALDRHSPVRP